MDELLCEDISVLLCHRGGILCHRVVLWLRRGFQKSVGNRRKSTLLGRSCVGCLGRVHPPRDARWRRRAAEYDAQAGSAGKKRARPCSTKQAGSRILGASPHSLLPRYGRSANGAVAPKSGATPSNCASVAIRNAAPLKSHTVLNPLHLGAALRPLTFHQWQAQLPRRLSAARP